jgi:small subunit ribosomal protein S19e
MILMVTVQETETEKLIKEMAKALKDGNILQMPEWARFAKTGVSRERPPEDPDWWFMRGASILRKIYLDGPVGTERLSTFYGGRKSYGHAPHHFAKSGGKIIRSIMQQLEKAELVKKSETKKKGRIIAPKGQKFVNAIAKQIK